MSLLGNLLPGIATMLGGSDIGAAVGSAQGQQLSQEQFSEQMTFNADQAAKNRAFQQGQQLNQEQFQWKGLEEQERYGTYMADTAMSRRMTDLKNAGVNPLLAVQGGFGGAMAPMISAPVGSAMPGSSASVGPGGAAQASAAGQANFNSAMALRSQDSQIALNNANAAQSAAAARKIDVDTQFRAGIETESVQQGIQESKTRQLLMAAQTEAQAAQAQLGTAQAAQVDAYIHQKLPAEIAQLRSATNLNDAQAILAGINQDAAALDVDQRRVINPILAQQLGAELQQLKNRLPESQANSEFWSTAGAHLGGWAAVGEIITSMLKIAHFAIGSKP